MSTVNVCRKLEAARVRDRGAAVLGVEPGAHGQDGAHAIMGPSHRPLDLVEGGEAVELAEQYARRSEANTNRIREFVDQATRGSGALGVYVPSRFVNVAQIGKLTFESVRFFDDASAHGK